ncbi:SIS domain-containing protein [bacterium 1XD8-76]|nr:SIS domain-containing protein [bacterium 1XD8-76]
MDLREMIEHYLESEIDILKKLDTEAVQKVVKAFEEAYERESAIYVFGNGGSAGTASHMANDFNKGISEYTEKKFRFQCLNDNIPTMLAVANDIGYDDVFSFQLKNKVKEKDLVIGISGSGNSENVIRALDCAKEQGAITMGIVGYHGGKVADIADIVFHVPLCNMQIVEDVHMILNHMVMSVVMQHWNIEKKA